MIGVTGKDFHHFEINLNTEVDFMSENNDTFNFFKLNIPLWVESNFEFAPRILGTRGHKFFQFLLANT